MTRIALVDDHVLFAQALSVALAADGYDVVAVPPTAQLVDAVVAVESELVLLDLALGEGLSGVDVLPSLTDHAPVVVLTGETDRALWGECLLAGARAVLEKSWELETISGVVSAVVKGDPVPAGCADPAWTRLARAQRSAMVPFEALSPREAQVLESIMLGRSATEIALQAVVSEATVRTQIRAVLTKLDVGSQLQAVAKARAHGWVPRAFNNIGEEPQVR